MFVICISMSLVYENMPNTILPSFIGFFLQCMVPHDLENIWTITIGRSLAAQRDTAFANARLIDEFDDLRIRRMQGVYPVYS